MGILCLRRDSAAFSPEPAGFGCVIRDHSSKVICALYGPLGVCDSTSAEVMGLRTLKRLGILGCMVEGDSEVVIRWGLGWGPGSWRHSSSLHEIWELAAAMSTSFHHVPRCQNSLADSLANRGVISLSLFCENYILEDC